MIWVQGFKSLYPKAPSPRTLNFHFLAKDTKHSIGFNTINLIVAYFGLKLHHHHRLGDPLPERVANSYATTRMGLKLDPLHLLLSSIDILNQARSTKSSQSSLLKLVYSALVSIMIWLEQRKLVTAASVTKRNNRLRLHNPWKEVSFLLIRLFLKILFWSKSLLHLEPKKSWFVWGWNQ